MNMQNDKINSRGKPVANDCGSWPVKEDCKNARFEPLGMKKEEWNLYLIHASKKHAESTSEKWALAILYRHR